MDPSDPSTLYLAQPVEAFPVPVRIVNVGAVHTLE